MKQPQITSVKQLITVLGATLFFALLMAFVTSGQDIRLDCTRFDTTTINCHFTRELTGWMLEEAEIDGIQSARVDSYRAAKGGTRYVAALLYAGGTYRIPYSNGPDSAEAQAVVDRINMFVSDRQKPSLTVRFNNELPAVFFICGWFTMSVVAIVSYWIFVHDSYTTRPRKIRTKKRR